SLDEFDIQTRRYDVGTDTWGAEETLASGFGDNTNAQVAIDEQGNAIAVWQGTSLDEFDIQTRRYDVGTDTWGAEETLASGFGDNTNAQVAIDAQGNAIAVWQGASLDEFDIETRRYDAGTDTWGAEETLASGFGDNTNAQVAIDAHGNGIAVWQGTSLDEFDIQTRRYDLGADTWGAEETLASGFGDNTNTQVAIDAQGNAIAVWQGTSLDEFDIQTRRCRTP
ncbi:MAG: hypothetical protein GY811_03120, partial [Myxococcales bacterium]|nr:hypothetical protein [Myxococcales bacterium]